MKSFDDFKRVELISTTGFSYQDCLIFDKTVLGRMVSKRRVRELALKLVAASPIDTTPLYDFRARSRVGGLF